MCTMSLDRYFTIKFPLKYGRNKTQKYMILKILFVWIISIAIGGSIFFLGIIDSLNVYDPISKVIEVTDYI